MDERRIEGGRRRHLPWRATLVALALVGGWLLPPSVGAAQTGGTQPRVCRSLQAALQRVGDRGPAAQAVAARLQRFGCPTGGPTTTGGSTPTTVFPTTTSVHVDCPLPGGGVGPCPTTTTIVIVDCPLPGGGVGPCPTTTVGPGNPGTTTTSILFPPTSLPTGPTSVPPTSTTLPPCSPTTTSQGQVPTTIPCAP